MKCRQILQEITEKFIDLNAFDGDQFNYTQEEIQQRQERMQDELFSIKLKVDSQMQKLPPVGEVRTNEEISDSLSQRLVDVDLFLGKELDSLLTGMQKTAPFLLIEKKEWNASKKALE